MPDPFSERNAGEPTSQAGPPRNFPSVPPPAPAGTEDRFTLQLLVNLQMTVSEVAAKTDRLIKDVEAQSSKLDAVRHQISFVRGAVWVVGILVAFLIAAAGLLLRWGPSATHAG